MLGIHWKIERNSIALAAGIMIVASIGGLIEIAPLFTIDETVETDPNMRVYTPLELAGRNIYMREGCYGCHSQMIRTLQDEVERYGPYSLAVESRFDHPMLWGSKRTGPDLARVGGKYSDQWQTRHLADPRSVVPQSNMPSYAWLSTVRLDTDAMGAHLRAQRRVGVPYSDEMIEHAADDAVAQASPDGQTAGLAQRYGAATQIRVFDGDAGGVTEMDALVAYLQILGRLTNVAHARPDSGDAGAMNFDHDMLVGFSKSFGLLYLIVMAAIALIYACWPSNKSKFDKAASDIVDDEDKPWR